MRRVLKPGMGGKDVRYAQHILDNNRFGERWYPHSITGRVDLYTEQGFRCAKVFLGYPTHLVNATFGTELEQYIIGPEHGGKKLPGDYLARRRKRLKHFHSPVRWRIVDYCEWARRHESQIHYFQRRPFPRAPRNLPLNIDCSAFVGLAYRDAGNAPDPHRENWQGYGNTSTLLARPHIPVADALPGDVVVFGLGYGHHACIVIKAGRRNPLLSSHGGEDGPKQITFAAEHRAQGFLPATFVRAL